MPRQPAKTTATHRLRVLTVIQSTEGWITGQQVAQLAGLTHKQAVDALNSLLNMAKIARTGRKFTARWGRIVVPTPDQDPLSALETAFRQGFFRK